jgi:hypothetical protein
LKSGELKLHASTERFKREWARVNDDWAVAMKTALLETVP